MHSERGSLRSEHQNPRGLSRLTNCIEAVAAPEPADIIAGVAKLRAVSPNSHYCFHRVTALLKVSEIALPSGNPNEIGYGCPGSARVLSKRIPQFVIEIKLRSMHDVHCTSRAALSNAQLIRSRQRLCPRPRGGKRFERQASIDRQFTHNRVNKLVLPSRNYEGLMPAQAVE